MSEEKEKVEFAPGVSRRELVGGCAVAAALLVLGGAGKAFASDGDFLRPPGGQDYEQFLGACIRCDRCRSACDREAITVCTVSDGIVNARLPRMSFQFGYCDMCDGEYKCIKACPTHALAPFDAEADKIGVAEIDPDECLTYILSGKCDARCVGACQWEALWLDEQGRLQIDQDKCNGCGACQFLCPSSAYGTYSGSGHKGINVVAVSQN